MVANWRTALSTYGVGGVSAYVRQYIAPAIRLTHTSHTEDQHGIGLGIGHTEDQHSPQAKADQGISSPGMGSDLAWTALILTQPLNQNQPLISSLISSYNSVSR